MGSITYKKFHNKKYDKNWNKKLEVFDPAMMISKKKNDSKITIEKIKD